MEVVGLVWFYVTMTYISHFDIARGTQIAIGQTRSIPLIMQSIILQVDIFFGSVSFQLDFRAITLSIETDSNFFVISEFYKMLSLRELAYV